MALPRLACLRLAPLLALTGCLLDANPDFDGPATTSSTASASETDTATSTAGTTATTSTTTAATTWATGETTLDTSDATTLPITSTSTTADMTTGDPLCGDGILEAGEACDDGNQILGDGCEPDCTLTCGNGLIDQNEYLIEECDDGAENGLGGGCSTACALEVCPAPTFIPCDALGEMPTWYESLGVGCKLLPGVDMREGAALLDKGALQAADPNSWRQLRAFGNFKVDANNYYYQARHGDSMLLLTTGVAGVPDMSGRLVEPPSSQLGQGDNLNPNMAMVPAPVVMEDGGVPDPFLNCAAGKDCSNTLANVWQALGPDPSIHDVLWAHIKLQAPRHASGFALDLAYFSAEWQYIDMGQIFRDIFVVWQVSESFTGNIAFFSGAHLDPASLKPAVLGGYIFKGAALELAGTGFEGQIGTPWLTLRGRVTVKEESAPRGDIVSLYLVLADGLDTAVTSVVLLDNFRWECGGDTCAAPQELAVCTSPSPTPACCGVSLPP